MSQNTPVLNINTTAPETIPVEQPQSNVQPPVQIPSSPNRNKKNLFVGLGVILFLLIILSTKYVYGNKNISTNPNTEIHKDVSFEEVQVRNNAAGSTTETICYFTELPTPIKKVIRTQKEYDSYLAEAEMRGYDAFAVNRDNDKFGTYTKYKDITTFETYRNYCKGQYNFPMFDFHAYTLLGQVTQTGGCSADFNRKVLRDNKNKTVYYTIDVNAEGSCMMAISSHNWILVPSIPNDYTVNFEVLTEGNIPPTPRPTPDLSRTNVPTEQAAIDVLNTNRAVQLWKSYMDELTEPYPSLRTYEQSPNNIQDKWHVSIQGIKGNAGDFFVVAWIDPYSGKIEVLNFNGSLERLSQEQQAAINAVNDLPNSL